MKRFLSQQFILFLLLAPKLIFSQVKFTETVIPSQIGKNEYAQLKLMVENADNVQQITPPILKNVTIVSGPSQESGTTIINNVVKKYVALIYFIKPNTTGKISIPAATAMINGVEVKSNTTSLQVSNAPGNKNSNNNNPASPFMGMDAFMDEAAPINDNILKKGESVQDKIQKNMFIKVDVDKTSCFVGEPVVVTYKLYTRLKSESVLLKNPSFNGFSVVDLQRPDNSNYSRETLNGKEYNVYIIRKAQLYPLQPGSIEVEKAEVENTIHFIKEEYVQRQRQVWDDIFNDFSETSLPAEAIEDHKIVLQSKPLFIDVKALPEAGRPANFKGAVGNFEITASLDKKSFTTDETGKLSLSISGEGNIQLVTAPEIVWPHGVEGYEPKITNTINKLAVPVNGYISYDYYFTTDSAGEYTIPAISFAYFDNTAGKYNISSTQPLNFKVIKGTAIKKNAVVQEKEDERFFNILFANRWIIILAVALIVITGLIIWVKRENNKDAKAKIVLQKNSDAVSKESTISANKAGKDWLFEVKQALNTGNSLQFYSLLNDAFKNYLSYKFNLPIPFDKKIIGEHLIKKNIPGNLSAEVEKVLAAIEWQLYTPFPDPTQQQNLLAEVEQLITNINAVMHQ